MQCNLLAIEAHLYSGSWVRFLIKLVTSAAANDGTLDYKWVKFNIFTVWLPFTEQTVVLLFDAPADLTDRIQCRLLGGGNDAARRSSPLWMYSQLVEEFVGLQESAVWKIRNLVRATEKARDKMPTPPPDFLYLHEVARHAVHVSESLDLGYSTVDGILAHQDRLAGVVTTVSESKAAATLLPEQVALPPESAWQPQVSFQLEQRTAAKRDIARVQHGRPARLPDLGRDCTRRPGRQCRDESDRFSDAHLPPATFVCAIFSMSFFNYDASSGEWSVSSNFWMYWAVAVPITVVTLLLWHIWGRRAKLVAKGGGNMQNGMPPKDWHQRTFSSLS